MVTVLRPLYHEAIEALQVNQRELAELLGLSTRTIQRWSGKQSSPSFLDYQALAKAVFPKDRELAARLAQAGSTTLDALLAGPQPAGAPVPGAGPAAEYVVDSIVCVAAVAMDVKPPEVRPALVAAFKRAHELQLTVEAVERALVGGAASAAAAKPTKEKPAKEKKG